MFSRFSRSWALVKASATVLKQDKELLWFPLFSSIAAILVAASFIVPVAVSGGFERLDAEGGTEPWIWAWVFAFYLSQYFVIFFFNSALVGAALIRLNGGDPTVSDGLRIASGKIGVIFGYAMIAATVGLILRMLEERLGWIGQWIVAAIGVAFTVATFLTVPILVSKDIGPIDAVKESASMLKKTWGENLIGNGGIGLAFFVIYLGLVAVAGGLLFLAVQSGSGALMAIVAGFVVVGFVIAALIQAALQGVYSAALYRYATEGQVGGEFSNDVMQDAFKLKA